MATRDLFLDALTVAPSTRPPQPRTTEAYVRRLALQQELEAARAENERLRRARKAPPPAARPPLTMTGPNYKPGTRPSFADEIDAMVAGLVDAGEIALDPVTDQYRTTRYKHLRFSAA